MKRSEIIEYIKENYQADPDHAFAPKYPDIIVFRHADTRKWFALCMKVEAEKLGVSSAEEIDVLTVKSEPMLIDGLVAREGYHRAYHMNKKLWLSVELEGAIPDAEICNLIDLSYELTQKKKRTK